MICCRLIDLTASVAALTDASSRASSFAMDEPTTGLHVSDIVHLLQIIDRIVDAGNTMIVIEHDLDVIRNADWIVDLGPEGGHKGGTVLFQGAPCDLLVVRNSLTAQYLS